MPALPEAAVTANAVPASTRSGVSKDRNRGHFHFKRLDLLAQVFWRASNHQAGDEYGKDGENQHAIQTGPDSAEHHFAQLHQQHRHHAAERRQGIMHRIHRAAGCRRGDRCEQGRCADAKACFLAFHVAAGLKCAGCLINAERAQFRMGLLLGD